MGWTSFKSNQPFLEIFRKEYEPWTWPGGETEIVKSVENLVPGRYREDNIVDDAEIFSAIRHKGIVYAHVLLIKRNDSGEVFYKGMDESVGPYTITKCPKEIMDMLSSIDKIRHNTEWNMDYAKEWREKQ